MIGTHDFLSSAHKRSATMKLKITRVLIAQSYLCPLPRSVRRRARSGHPLKNSSTSETGLRVGVVVKKPRANKIEFRIDDYLFQSDEELLTVTVDADVFAEVAVGKEYMLVFSRMKKIGFFATNGTWTLTDRLS